MKRLACCMSLLLVMFFCAATGWSQQAPTEAPPVNAAGKWTLYCNDPNGTTSTKYLDLKQEGATIKGHFKGVYQSGGVEGTINEHHLVVKTKTRDVTVFRGRVYGDTFNGNFHNRGGKGTFQGQRTQ
jgi:hypothetical protein